MCLGVIAVGILAALWFVIFKLWQFFNVRQSYEIGEVANESNVQSVIFLNTQSPVSETVYFWLNEYKNYWSFWIFTFYNTLSWKYLWRVHVEFSQKFSNEKSDQQIYYSHHEKCFLRHTVYDSMMMNLLWPKSEKIAAKVSKFAIRSATSHDVTVWCKSLVQVDVVDGEQLQQRVVAESSLLCLSDGTRR